MVAHNCTFGVVRSPRIAHNVCLYVLGMRATAGGTDERACARALRLTESNARVMRAEIASRKGAFALKNLPASSQTRSNI